jgi:hypothetical protein
MLLGHHFTVIPEERVGNEYWYEDYGEKYASLFVIS